MANIDYNYNNSTYIHSNGKVWVTVPKFPVRGGQLYAEGELFGVAVADGFPANELYPNGKLTTFAFTGCIDLQLDSTVESISQGQAVYITVADVAEGKQPLLTTTAKSNLKIGYSLTTIASGAANQVIEVLLSR